MNPLALSQMTGLPSGKKHQRGPHKRSTRPGAEHLDALTKAHGKGDHHGAKLAALNYANAVTKHLSATATDAKLADAQTENGIAPATAAITTQKAPDARARLARLATMRGKAKAK